MNSLATIRYSFLGIRRGRAFGLHRAAQRALFGAILPDSLLQTLSQTATRAPRRTKNQEVTVATQVTAATLPGAQPITTAAERRVIIASSVGTVFEGKVHRGAAVGIRDLCRGILGPAIRRHILWTDRGSGWKEIHVLNHHSGDGRFNCRGGYLADLRHRRILGSGSAGRPPTGPGIGAGRGVRWGGDLCGRALAG